MTVDALRVEPSIRPPLQVDGTVLRDRDGNRVGLRGVAVQMVPFYAGAAPNERDTFLERVTQRNYHQRAAEFAALRVLGYNAVRLHIPGPALYASEVYEPRSVSVVRIERIVAAAKLEGLVTILDADAIGDDLADWHRFKPMFSDIVARIGDDPWVIWEPFNEPADYADGAPNYLAAVKGVGAFLRSIGVRQPLILPCNEYQQRVSPVLMNEILADASSNGWQAAGVLFGVHPYLDHLVSGPASRGDILAGPVLGALRSELADNVRSYPLIVSEMGRYNNAIATTNATRGAYKYVAGLGTAGLNGLITWSWDWALSEEVADPNAWTWDGLHLNSWGRQSHREALSTMQFPPIASGAMG